MSRREQQSRGVGGRRRSQGRRRREGNAGATADLARDLITDTSKARLDLPVDEGVSEEDWDFEAPHHGLALSHDETLLCLAGRASDYAAIVRTDDLSLVTTVDTGDAPSWAAISAGDRYCVLPNTRSGDVSIIDLENATEAARIPTGRGAKHVTIGQVAVSALGTAGQ